MDFLDSAAIDHGLHAAATILLAIALYRFYRLEKRIAALAARQRDYRAMERGGAEAQSGSPAASG